MYGSIANAADPVDALAQLAEASGFTALGKSDA